MAANPFQYAVSQVQKKAQELFNNQVVRLGQSSAGKGLVNFQRFIESPQRVQAPQIAPYNPRTIPGKVGNFATNAAFQIAAAPITTALNIGFDTGKVIGGQAFRGHIPAYTQLKTSPFKLAYNAKGQQTKPQEVIGNIAGTGADALAMYFPSGGGAIANQAIKTGTRKFLPTVMNAAAQGARFGGAYGVTSALSDNRNLSLQDQLKAGGSGLLQGAAGGALLGGALGATGYIGGSVAKAIKKTFPNKSPKDIQTIERIILRNERGQFSKDGVKQAKWVDRWENGRKITEAEIVEARKKIGLGANPGETLQTAESSVKLPEYKPPVAPQVVNGKIKMKPISAPTLETPAVLSSSQELAESGAGGGSSIKSTQEIINPQDPYFNVKRLNINPKKQQVVKVAIEEAKPQFEEVVGKKLSNKEVVDFSNQSAKVLNRAVNREQTKQWSASMLKAREQLAKSAQDDKLTPEFLETLINVKSQGADIARKLQSLSINADPKTVTAKQAILEAVLKVTNNSDDILKAAKGVDFNDQAQATAFYRQFVKPSAEDWLTLVRYNSMLSSPNTHIVNTSSNFQGTGIVAPIEKTVLGGIDWMRSKATGTNRRYYAGEGIEYAKGYYSSIKEASKNFSKVMRGESMSGNPDIRQLPLTTKKGIAQTTEKVLNYPMRLLEGMDQFFSTLTKGGVEQSLNYRASQGLKVGNIASKAEQEAAERLFRGELSGTKQGTVLNAIDQVTNLVFRARSNDNPIVRTMAQFTFPFVKTPMNIVKQMVEYSPLGVTTLPGAQFKQEQLAKAILGSSVALGAAQLLSSDRLTWAEPTSEKQRNAFRAAGLQPYAIKLGDKWVSYSKLHPVIGFNLAMVSALDDAFKNKKLSESEVETALTGLAKWWGYFADQSYVKNMGDLVSSARGDVSGMARMISNYPTQVIPFRALMSWVERLVDPYQRQADPNGSILDKQLQLIGSQLPGIAGNIPTRKNIYGEPVENQNRLLNSFSPAKITTEKPEQKIIFDNMQEKSRLEKQIKDIRAQAKKDISVSEGTDPTYTGSDEVMKARFQASGAGSWNIGGKLYIKTDSDGVKVVDLQPNPTGNAIQQAKQSASNESQIKTTGVNAYFSTKLSDFDKNTIYKALGTNAQDVEFKALASLPDDKQASVLYDLLKERKWKQEKVDAFIKSDVLTNSVVGKMEDQGLINESQAKDLKAYIKSTSIKLGKVSAGSGKKAKKIKMPKLKTIKVKYSKLKIKIPKPKKYKALLSKGKSNKYFK